MSAPDPRARLEAIAAGKADVAPGLNTVAPSTIQRHADAFNQWSRFARENDGEPLNAPAEVLAPLP